MKLQYILFVGILSFGFQLMPVKSHADGGATVAAAAAAWAIQKAEEENLFDCAFHLGADQCRNIARCNRSLSALERAKSGSAEAISQLNAFINNSSMQKNCVRSLEGGHFSALMENLEYFSNPPDFLPKMVAVYRWYHTPTKDWLTVSEANANDQWYISRNYTHKTFNFVAYGNKPPHDDNKIIRVYRWYHSPTKDWLTVGENSANDQWYTSRNYTNKTFTFWAFSDKPSIIPSGYKAIRVYRWYHTPTKDWITVSETNANDQWYADRNYKHKTFMFWALLKV